MIRVALRGLAARPLRTVLTAVAIVLGVAMVAGAFTLTDTMRSAAGSLDRAAYGGTDAVVSSPQAFTAAGSDALSPHPTADPALIARIRALPGIAVAAGDVTDQAQIIGRDGTPAGDGPYFGAGLDARAPGVARVTPFRLEAGRWATGPGEVVIDAATAKAERLAVGDAVRVAARRHVERFRVVGLSRFGTVESLGTGTSAVFDLRTAQRLFGRGTAVDSILVAGTAGTTPAAVRAELARALPQQQIRSARAQDRFGLGELDTVVTVVRIALLAFGGIAVLVGALTIFNSLSITVAQRTQELALLRMVGARRPQVMGAVLLEALVLGLAASAVGIGAGLGLAAGLGALLQSMDFGLPREAIGLDLRTVIVAGLVGTLATVAAGAVPAWRATRVAPVLALRAAGEGGRALRLPGRIAAGVVSVVGRPAALLGGTAGDLARRNAMRRPGRTLTTATALVIGVALVTLVTVVATGLKDAAKATIEQRVAATHLVVGTDGWSPIDHSIERVAAGAPGVQAASSLGQAKALAFGDRETVNAVEPGSVRGILSLDWVRGSDAVLAGLGADGAVVDEGWAEEHGLTVGSRFALTSAGGERLPLVVRGIERSPVIDLLGLGPITIGRPAFDAAFGQSRDLFTMVRTTDGPALAQALAGHPEVRSVTRAAFVQQKLDDVSSILSLFFVLLALAVIVSLFGIVNTLVLATFERTKELGTLRALGMTGRQVRRMVRHESVIAALLGALAGMAVGLAGAWAVTRALADAGLAFAVPVGSLVAFAVIAVLAGVLAAVLPARRAARVPVTAALAAT
jgi:putative ABC transport system permease protein